RLPIARACSYIRQAALGLEHAFECGMVHRDIKPQNLMVVSGESVSGESVRGEGKAANSATGSHHSPLSTPRGKILDFGLARFVSETIAEGAAAIGSRPPTGDARLTQASSFMGTPEYIAPEQARAASAADIRADIYSLGCTLYHLLAGHA